MNAIFAIAWKDVRLLLRDRTGFFFVFFMPLLFGIFFGIVFSGGGEGRSALGIDVVDLDRSPASRSFVNRLAGAEEVDLAEVPLAEARDRVRRGKRLAYVVIPEGFAESRDRIFQGDALHLQVGVDPSRKAAAGMLQGVLTRYAFQEFREIFKDREAVKAQARSALESVKKDAGLSPLTRMVLERFLGELERFMEDLPEDENAEGEGTPGEAGEGNGTLPAFEPIRIEFREVRVRQEGPRSSFEVTFPQSILWVLIGCSAAFAVSLVTERTRGTLLRLRAAPVGFLPVVAGKGLACFLVSLAGAVFLTAIFRFFFSVRPASPGLLLLAFFCASYAYAGIMMVLAVLGRTEAAAGGLAWAVNLVMAMAGGGMVPLFFMPPWMRSISDLSYAKWAVLAVEGAVWRGFSWNEMLPPCAVLLAAGTVCLAAGTLLLRRRGEG